MYFAQSLPLCASETLVPPAHPAPKPPTLVAPKLSVSPSCSSPLIPATPPPLPKTVVLTTDTTVKEVRTLFLHKCKCYMPIIFLQNQKVHCPVILCLNLSINFYPAVSL